MYYENNVKEQSFLISFNLFHQRVFPLESRPFPIYKYKPLSDVGIKVLLRTTTGFARVGWSASIFIHDYGSFLGVNYNTVLGFSTDPTSEIQHQKRIPQHPSPCSPFKINNIINSWLPVDREGELSWGTFGNYLASKLRSKRYSRYSN